MSQLKYVIKELLKHVKSPQIIAQLELVAELDTKSENVILAKYALVLLGEIFEQLITNKFSLFYPFLSRVKERWKMIEDMEIALVDDAGDLTWEIANLAGNEDDEKFDLGYVLFSFSHDSYNEDWETWETDEQAQIGTVYLWRPVENLIEFIQKSKPEEEAQREINRIGAYLLDTIYEYRHAENIRFVTHDARHLDLKVSNDFSGCRSKLNLSN